MVERKWFAETSQFVAVTEYLFIIVVSIIKSNDEYSLIWPWRTSSLNPKTRFICTTSTVPKCATTYILLYVKQDKNNFRRSFSGNYPYIPLPQRSWRWSCFGWRFVPVASDNKTERWSCDVHFVPVVTGVQRRTIRGRQEGIQESRQMYYPYLVLYSTKMMNTVTTVLVATRRWCNNTRVLYPISMTRLHEVGRQSEPCFPIGLTMPLQDL